MFSISSSFRSLVVSFATAFRSRQWSHVTCQSRFSDFLPLFCPDDSIEQLEKLRSTFSPRASCSESSGRRCFANWPKRNQKIIRSHIEHGENFIRLVPAKVGAVRTANHHSLSQFSAFARDALDDNFIEFIFFPSRPSTRLLARHKTKVLRSPNKPLEQLLQPPKTTLSWCCFYGVLIKFANPILTEREIIFAFAFARNIVHCRLPPPTHNPKWNRAERMAG